jgi:hypothetical protein
MGSNFRAGGEGDAGESDTPAIGTGWTRSFMKRHSDVSKPDRLKPVSDSAGCCPRDIVAARASSP